jgi:hypothetical protein
MLRYQMIDAYIKKRIINMIYRKCPICGNKVPQYTECACETTRRRESYKQYQARIIRIENEKKVKDFYNSDEWNKCKANVAAHQFHLDIMELSRGNIVQADLYHHIIEVKDDWESRLDTNNIVGLTQGNHNHIHALMNRSAKEKRMVQDMLRDILENVENSFF